MAVFSYGFEQCTWRIEAPGSAVHGCCQEFGPAASVQLERLPILKQLDLLRFKRNVSLHGREQARRHRRENQEQG
jgi:hypothetical protein